MSKQYVNIPGTLKNVASDGIVAYSDSIYDEDQHNTQNNINSNFNTRLNNTYNKSEVYTKQQTDSLLPNPKYTIEVWSNILSNNFAEYLLPESGRNIQVYNINGTSSNVRQDFINNVNESRKNNTFIFYISRDDYIEENLKRMVNHIGHPRFIVCMSPNGYFNTGETITEGKGESGYNKYINLQNYLQDLYPNNFVNTRRACIEEYNMGDVRLSNYFIQPNIDETVTITVSDAQFLTTYPNYYSAFRDKIVIGKELDDNVDIYEIKGVNGNELLVQLKVNGSNVSPGNALINPTNNSIQEYLKVVQYSDYMFYTHDVIQNTLRIESLKMNETGERLLAKILERAILTKGL